MGRKKKEENEKRENVILDDELTLNRKNYIMKVIQNNSTPEEESFANGFFEQNTTYAILDEATLPIRIFDPADIEFTDAYAYAHNGFFYLFRGETLNEHIKTPGIYFNPDSKKYFMVEVDQNNQNEVDAYKICANHIAEFNHRSIIDDLKENKDTIYSKTERSAKNFCPKVDVNDDSLKRIMKMALLKKGIDIDLYRDRFTDKNATFNFKQVIKNDAKLSMLLFERGCDAFKLKYTIILEEADPNDPIGEPLDGKLIVSSDDTFEL